MANTLSYIPVQVTYDSSAQYESITKQALYNLAINYAAKGWFKFSTKAQARMSHRLSQRSIEVEPRLELPYNSTYSLRSY